MPLYRPQISRAVMCVKSATAQSGLSGFNSSSFAPPVATASVFAPMNFPQRTSNGVSPMTTISCGCRFFPSTRRPRSSAAAAMWSRSSWSSANPPNSKTVPQPEMAQLDFRAEPDVAGEQAEHGRLRQRVQIVDQFPDAGADLRVAARKDVVEPENVALEKLREMFRRLRQAVDAEKFADEADVGAAGELHFFRAVMQLEFRGKRFGKRLRAGVARVDERAVNVEQNQFHHARKISEHAESGEIFRRAISEGQCANTAISKCSDSATRRLRHRQFSIAQRRIA